MTQTTTAASQTYTAATVGNGNAVHKLRSAFAIGDRITTSNIRCGAGRSRRAGVVGGPAAIRLTSEQVTCKRCITITESDAIWAGSATTSTHTTAAAVEPAPADRVLDAIRANATVVGWAPLAAIREDAGLTRPDFDAAMTELAVTGRVNLVPEDNQKTLRQADLSAALHIGGEDKHLAQVAEAAAPAASTEDRIITAIRQLIARPGDLASLARVRAAMPDVDHAEMTRVLKAMDRARVIQLDPDPNRKALPQIAIDSAVELGGELKHLVSLI